MNYMDRLPTVISCCFCCFLRAGTVMIAIFSFYEEMSNEQYTVGPNGHYCVMVTPSMQNSRLDMAKFLSTVLNAGYSVKRKRNQILNYFTLVLQLSGLVFAPNVTHTKGFWNMDPVLSYYSSATENTLQFILGAVSIVLCLVSVFLLVGSICNIPILILVYQWGAIVYSFTVFLMFFILSIFCFFIHTNCVVAGAVLFGLMIIQVLVTMYFVIVANSLRMTLKFLTSESTLP